LKKGVEFFRQAFELDPSYALAYSGLADSYNLLSYYSVLRPKEAMPRAKAAALRALELDPALAEAHTSLASIKSMYDWDWAGAESGFKRAIELNPAYPTAHHWYAWYLVAMGRFAEALAEIESAQELDPLSLVIGTRVGTFLYYAREYERAIEQLQRTLELDSHYAQAHFWLGLAYEQVGRYEAAAAELQKAIDTSGDDVEMIAALGHTYAVAGQRDAALTVLADLERRAQQRYVMPYYRVPIYVGLGDHDSAFEWLEKAFLERPEWLVYTNVYPVLDPLRADPRFASLLQRLGFPPAL
jgi:tetratricopeptide (TPR) repeat protein